MQNTMTRQQSSKAAHFRDIENSRGTHKIALSLVSFVDDNANDSSGTAYAFLQIVLHHLRRAVYDAFGGPDLTTFALRYVAYEAT
eukprot:SAG31_NODE_2960_length_4850_cov_5.261840_3_plen_85_part_00